MSQGPSNETQTEEQLIVHTGSISSSVELDFEHNLAHKVYHPKGYVRLLYWLAFQAPFPYVSNHAALEAAHQRRLIVDLLAKFWFGHDLVADVVAIKDVNGEGHDFVTELVRGNEPPHKKRVWRFLKQLDRRFLDAGLPTWQVTPYNPHAITNFIETNDGTYRGALQAFHGKIDTEVIMAIEPVAWRTLKTDQFLSNVRRY